MFIEDKSTDSRSDASHKGSDETSKETEKDTEETESEEEDGTTEGEVEDNEESEEDGGDETSNEAIAKKYLSDPNSVPKELQPAFKKMQAIFTRGMQGAAEAKTKAARFDLLLAHPAFQTWVREQQGLTSSKKRSSREEPDEDDSDEEEDGPVTKKDLKRYFDQFKEEANTNTQMAREDEQMRVEAKQFKKNHPDWKIYQAEIFDILDRNPRLSYEEAYYLTTREESTVKSDEERIRDKKRAKINKPSPNSVKGEVQKKSGKMKLSEAWDNAAKKLGFDMK